MRTAPKPASVGKPAKQKLGELDDFLVHTFWTPREKQRKDKIIRAKDVNTLGEVPDGPWYENRLSRRPMTIAELVRGAGNEHAPSPDGSWKITAAKAEGVSPGFRIEDARGNKYLVKFDPPSNPEMASAADVIVAKFLHALGYHVPENYIVTFHRQQLTVGDKVEFTDPYGRRRRMSEKDVDELLKRVPRTSEGQYRAMASRILLGEVLGPFRFHGVRSDDPNDVVAHEHRRELRALFVFAAWLGHHDAKSLNSLDTLVEEDGVRYIKHHLIDFGSALGSASTAPKGPRAGNEHLIDCKPAVVQFLTFGLVVPRWARADYPNIPAVGRLEWKVFEPEKWKPNYPNPAFQNRLPDDTFWAAKQVMSFDDDQIRALVNTGMFSDPKAVEWLTATLIGRRDKIGRTYFDRVLPLDGFEIRGDRLEFEDLAVKHRFKPRREYQLQWFNFDNDAERRTALPGRTTVVVPAEAQRARPGAYFAVDVHAGEPAKNVSVYLRKSRERLEVVGLERNWGERIEEPKKLRLAGLPSSTTNPE